jgi:hypothetical protein
LVFAVQLYEPHTQVVLAHEARPMELIQAGNQQTHMLEGRPASTLLESLRKASAKITAKPAVGQSYVIPVSDEDFDFAVGDFEACVKGL